MVESSKSSMTAKKILRNREKGVNTLEAVSALPARYANNRQILEGGLLSLLAAQAIQALESKGISAVEQRSIFRESIILKLHEVGLSSISKPRSPLEVK